MLFVRAASLLALAAAAGAVRVREGLVDNPIQTGIAPQYLDGEGWLLSNTNGSIVVGASVPGDIVTDLEANNVIGDPIFEASTQTHPTHPPARPPLTLDNPSWALDNLDDVEERNMGSRDLDLLIHL